MRLRGMNRIHLYRERVVETARLIAEEEEKLSQYGYDPRNNSYIRTPKPEWLEPVKEKAVPTPQQDTFISALQTAFSSLKISPKTRLEIKSTLKYVQQAAQQLGLAELPITGISRKHIKAILDTLSQQRKWQARSWNAYRAYLMMLFEELLQLELVEHNPARQIKRMTEPIKMRETLTDEKRAEVREFLAKHYPDFYRFVQIFFHSGARRTELLNLKVADVDLPRKYYKVTVTKGPRSKEVIRVIKDIALPFWQEQLHKANSGYVFSVGLLPGPKKIREEQLTRRWRRLVKDKLGITADLYSLKHLNTDEIAAALGIEDAAAHNSHTSSKITLKHYSKGEQARQRERIGAVKNSL